MWYKSLIDNLVFSSSKIFFFVLQILFSTSFLIFIPCNYSLSLAQELGCLFPMNPNH